MWAHIPRPNSVLKICQSWRGNNFTSTVSSTLNFGISNKDFIQTHSCSTAWKPKILYSTQNNFLSPMAMLHLIHAATSFGSSISGNISRLLASTCNKTSYGHLIPSYHFHPQPRKSRRRTRRHISINCDSYR